MIRSDLQEDKILDWYVIESSEELFKVQILFNQEDLVSDEPQTLAKLQLTFWGTEFFKSEKENTEVRLGTSMEWPILSQVSHDDMQTVDSYGSWIKPAMFALLVAMVPFCSLGTFLPTWMFLNTF